MEISCILWVASSCWRKTVSSFSSAFYWITPSRNCRKPGNRWSRNAAKWSWCRRWASIITWSAPSTWIPAWAPPCGSTTVKSTSWIPFSPATWLCRTVWSGISIPACTARIGRPCGWPFRPSGSRKRWPKIRPVMSTTAPCATAKCAISRWRPCGWAPGTTAEALCWASAA